MLTVAKKFKNSIPIATIYGGPRHGQYLCLDESSESGRNKIGLAGDEHFIMEPSHDVNGRDLVFCAGPSGSGKSTFIRQFSARYRSLWPDRPIVLISKLGSDDSLPSGGPIDIRRIRVDSLIETKLELDELTACLLLVDDIEGLPRDQSAAVQELVDLVCNQGRHFSISMVYASHLLTDYKRTRTLLHECQNYVLYPSGTSFSQMRHMLCHYGGLDAKQVAAIRKVPSRWVAIRKLYPPLVVCDGSAYLLNQD